MKIQEMAKGLILLTSVLSLAACSEPTGPSENGIAKPLPANSVMAKCRVDVRALSLTCDDFRASVSSLGEIRPDVIIGRQDLFVRLTSSGTSYDNGTQILSSNVNIQNLIKQAIGTSDGFTVSGVKIFFHSGPTVTGGSGTVDVFNSDGTGTFTGAGQPYFVYSEIIDPYEISQDRNWQFSLPPTVTTFEFTVLLSAPVADETASFIDRLWTGTAGTTWSDASNWQGGVPVDTSTVAVPPASMITSGNQPVLDGSITLKHLRVAATSSLDLGGFTVTASGNVDAPGAITNGVISMTGSNTYLGGNLDRVIVGGNTKLQRATKTTGAMSINGSLSVSDKALTISIQ